MEQINGFFENIKERNLIDVLISIVIIIVFYMVSSLFSKLVMKLLKIKGNDKEKIKNSIQIIKIKLKQNTALIF